MAQARAGRARGRALLGTHLGSRQPRAPRRVSVLVAAVFVVECTLYSAVTPLLPHYAAAYSLSKTAAGALAAAYSVGFLAGAPIGGLIAARDARRTVLAGLVMFAGSAAAFGAVGGIAWLDSLRALQGVAGGIIWSGGLVWLIGATARARRAAALGSAFAAATAGTLLGPVLGTAAVAAGSAAVFAVVGGVALLLALAVVRAPVPPRAARIERVPLSAALRQPALLTRASLIALVGATLGTLGVLVPLRLFADGASSFEIGVTFVIASALAAAGAPLAGALADRRGPIRAIGAGLAVVAASLVGLSLARSPALVAALTVVCVAGAAGGCLGPCFALVADTAERGAISLAAATAVANVAFALGEALGASGGPALAQAAGASVTLLVLLAGVALAGAAAARTLQAGDAPAASMSAVAEHVEPR